MRYLKKVHKILMPVLLLVLTFPALAQRPEPAPPQGQRILIYGGAIHVGNGKVIDFGAVGIENGKITQIAEDADLFDRSGGNWQIINATGKHIYPGLIALNSILGLVEVEAVRATRDFAEVGDLNPNARALIAYNADSRIIPTVRSNGILLAQIVPQGGLISGTSSVVQLDAWNWEDAAYANDNGLHLFWPQRFYNTGWWAEPGETKKRDNQERLQEIYELFEQAHNFSSQKSSQKANLKLEAMAGLFDSSKTLFVHVDHVRGITGAVELAKKYGIKLAIVGGYDAWLIPEVLKENNVPVIISEVHRLPKRPSDDIDLPYKMAYILDSLGIDFAISMTNSWNQRNLPFQAGAAAAFGISKERALEAVTLAPARILGIDSITGSIEVGKDANIIISEGDLLDMDSNNILHAFIKGRKIDLNNHQLELYFRYKEKYDNTTK